MEEIFERWLYNNTISNYDAPIILKEFSRVVKGRNITDQELQLLLSLSHLIDWTYVVESLWIKQGFTWTTLYDQSGNIICRNRA